MSIFFEKKEAHHPSPLGQKGGALGLFGGANPQDNIGQMAKLMGNAQKPDDNTLKPSPDKNLICTGHYNLIWGKVRACLGFSAVCHKITSFECSL